MSTDKEKVIIDENDAILLEKQHVYNVYDKIADEFSDSRYRAWPNVKKFVENLPFGSIMLDVGTGNGKNLNLNQNIISIGCDTSTQLLEICRKRNFECFAANALRLPFKSNSLDACIFISVLHHIATENRRLTALKEIVNIMKIDGQCLVYVWAFEQEIKGTKSNYIKKKYDEKIEKEVFFPIKPAETDDESNLNNNLENNEKLIPIHNNGMKFRHQELFIPWKKKNLDIPLRCQELRYYYVFKKGELEQLVSKIENVKIINSYYDNGNWAVIFEKNQSLIRKKNIK